MQGRLINHRLKSRVRPPPAVSQGGCGKASPVLLTGHVRRGCWEGAVSRCGCWAREEPKSCWKIKPLLIKADGKQTRVIWHYSWETEVRFEAEQL